MTGAILVVAYLGALDNPLIAPDAEAVVQSYYLGDPALAVKLFVTPQSETEAPGSRYSPLAWLSLATDNALWGGSPAGFRVVSLLIHLGSAVFLFLVIVRFGVAPVWAMMGALLFAVHPLHTQAVNMASSRGHILAGALTFIAIFVFMGHLEAARKKVGLRRPPGSWAAVALFTAGLFAGSEALGFLIFCALSPYLLGVRYPHPRFYAGVVLGLVLYLVMGAAAAGIGATGVTGVHRGAASFTEGLRLVVFPAGQMLYHPVAFVSSYADGRALAAVGVVAATLIVCVLISRRTREGGLALGLAGCASLATFFTVGRWAALNEPALYLLVGGLGATIAAVAGLLSSFRRARPVLMVILMVLIAAGVVRSRERNAVWSSPELVWLEVVSAYPDDQPAVTALAEHYRSAGLTQKAAELISPVDEDAHARAVRVNNEGVALRDAGRTSAAIEKFREAVDLRPGFRDAHFNLGVVYHSLGKMDSAAVNLERAVRADPSHAETRYNLGVVYDEMGELDRAAYQYGEALRLDPGHARAWANLGATRGKRGDLEGAISALENAVEMDPALLQARYNLAFAYESVDRKKAKELWRDYLNLARRRGVSPDRLRQIEERLEAL